MTVANTFLSETRVQAARVISPVGDLTAATMPELRRAVARSLSEGAGRIIIDLSGVPQIDGFGRAGLAACSRAADAAHASLVVTGVPAVRSGRGDDATTSTPNTQAATRCPAGMPPRDPVGGGFVRATITGRVLRCGDAVGHRGDHQEMRPKSTTGPKRRTRPGVLR